MLSTEKESSNTSLPPPSALFSGYYPSSNYVLPPPSTLPGYRSIPPQQHFIYHQQLPTPPASVISSSTEEDQQIETKKTSLGRPKRGRRQKNDSTTTTTINKRKKNHHYEILELRQQKKTTKKQQRKELEAAAATLASFANITEREECVKLEACAGQGGQYQCDHCGYNYKHLNCLQRHKWEQHTDICHTMTKHQQNQLLEAAQILMDIAHYGMKIRIQ